MGLKFDRRKFLGAAGAGAAAISFSELRPVLAQQATRDPKEVKPELAKLKALVFDTFGTVVDWRGSVIAEGTAWGKAKGLNIDWVSLKKKYVIAPLSNGNIALMTNLAKFAGLPWDAILGSELVRHYKPDREVYVSAYYYLGLKPEEVMMCAAHAEDLKAARSNGLRTGFIYRPNEYGNGPVGVPDKARPGDFDVVSPAMTDLAQQLGA